METSQTVAGYDESPTLFNRDHKQICNKDVKNLATFLKDCRNEREQLEKNLDQKNN